MQDKLARAWTVWLHRANDRDWGEGSYSAVKTTADPDEMWGALLAVRRHFADAMFFLMREGVPPLWEHPANIDGGCYSLRVPTERAWDVFEDIVARAVTCTMGDQVVGVSNSSKGKFQVIKVWCSSCHNPGIRIPAGARFTPNREKNG